MPKQVQTLPAQETESSTEKPPSLRSRPSDTAPSLRGHSLDPAPSMRGRPSDPAPSMSGRPSDPAPSMRGAPSSVPRSSLQPASSKRNPLELEASFAPVLHPTGPRKKVDVTIHWSFATIALLFICTTVCLLVFIMSSQVSKMSKTLEKHSEALQVQILILSEILQQLQIGKVLTCSVCRIQWVQYAGNCYLLGRRKMSWASTMGYCKDKSSSLPFLNSTEEMDFLRHESKKYFDSYHKKLKFWMGLKYEPSTRKWLQIDGSVLNIKQPEELTHKGCIYLQNGKLYSQLCSEEAYVICQAKVQLG